MRKRGKVSKKGSRKLFSKTAGTHRKNVVSGPMRGGIRL